LDGSIATSAACSSVPTRERPGRRISDGSSAAREVRIVGVVADNPVRPTVERPDPVVYVPHPKQLSGEFTLRVRAADPEALRADLLTLVNGIDPRIAWTSIRRGDMRFQDEAREILTKTAPLLDCLPSAARSGRDGPPISRAFGEARGSTIGMVS
jgi:hypothetical protein